MSRKSQEILNPWSILLLCAAASTAACMISPANGHALCSKEAPVTFSGYVTTPNATVVVESASTPAGPYVAVAQAISSASESLTGLYAWRTGAALTSWSTSRTGHEIYVRARLIDASTSVSLVTFDSAATTGGPSGLSCLAAKWQSQGYLAVLACRSPDSPIVRLGAPLKSTCACDTTHLGDLTIASAEDVYRWHCLQTLTGSLHVPAGGSYLQSFSLPALTTVTGSVDLDFSPPAFRPPGPPAVRTIDLPALATVTENVGIFFSNTTITGPIVDAGMGALTNVGGNVSAQILHVSPSLKGLTAVTTLSGNVTLTGVSDLFAFGFLNALTHVGGDVHLNSNNSTGGILGALSSIDGSLVIEHSLLYGTFGFANLQTIGASFTLSQTNWSSLTPHTHFPALTSVSGTLSINQKGPQTLSRIGSPSLLAGGLSVTQSDLCAMEATHLHIGGAGPITITNNVNLANGDAQTFVNTQQMAGWLGTPTLSGNSGAGCP